MGMGIGLVMILEASTADESHHQPDGREAGEVVELDDGGEEVIGGSGWRFR